MSSLLALASPELEILAITVTFGNTDVEHSYRNVLKLWHAVHKHLESHPEDNRRFPVFAPDYDGNVPFLARGSSGPLQGELYNAEEFHGKDGLSDISTRHPELSVPEDWHSPRLRCTNQPAAELSLGLIEQYPAFSITYIALGPLTNLALMMRKNAPLVRHRIGRIIAMGGALEAAGNVTAVAEFNLYADPFAARELLHPPEPSMGLPLNRFMLLPLDITTKHELKFPDYQKVVDPAFGTTDSPSKPHDKSPLVHFVSSFLEQTAEVMRHSGVDALELHDPVTVWCAICNPPVVDEGADGPLLSRGWTTQMRRFQIEKTGDLTRGMLVVDRRQEAENYLHTHKARAESRARAAVEVEPKEHKEELLDSIQGVAVVTDTPGPDALVSVMMERIWGLRI